MAVGRLPIGVFVQGETKPEGLVEVSRLAETRGFAELWFSEDYFMLSGFSSAAIALQATSGIMVGVGAVSAVVRHPAVTAMEASTLAGAYPGRFKLAIGHGVPAWVKQMHLFPKSVLGAMRESVTGVKRLLAGETLTEKGAYFGYDNVKLTHPAPDLKVLTAVVGPKSVDLCAEIADGMVISVLAGPKYVEFVKQRITGAREAAGRPTAFEFPTYVLTSVDPDRAKARAKVRPFVAFYLAAVGPTLLTDVYGLNDALGAMIEKGGLAAVEQDMPDGWIDSLAIAGTPEECVKGIRSFHAAGATSVVLCVVPTDELAPQLEIIARDVLPAL